MGIVVICGQPGKGKTSLMTHFLVQAMFDKERMRKMKRAIKAKQEGGFKRTIPPHPVWSNYYIEGRKYLYSHRISQKLKPFHLGFVDPLNKGMKMHNLPPYAVIGITEGQKYLNSRKSAKYPDWQSRWYEAHRHNNYDIYIDIQRFDLVDLNVRELAEFIEIQGIEHGEDIRWTIRKFESARHMERYVASGGFDKSTYTEEVIIADYDVHQCYDSQMCEPQFEKGQEEKDYDLKLNKPRPFTKQEYKEYNKRRDDDCPEVFYGIKKENKKGVK
jgi:hypothetical protein